LVCLTNLFLLWAIATQEHTSVAVQALARSAAIPVSQSDTLYARWQTTSALAIGVAAFAGTLWCAFVLWFTGRWCLKTSFRFRQSLAVTGLGSMILALGALVTALLVLATGDRAARPALSLLAPGLPLESPLRLAMETLNFFHLWIAAVLTLGLSKLSSVSAKEAGFWVFSYWVAARLGLILLA
jgi:hypothetical protein